MNLTPEQTEKLKQIDFLREKIRHLQWESKSPYGHLVGGPIASFTMYEKHYNKPDFEYIKNKIQEIRQAELELAFAELEKLI
jgi:hypothetical protein